MTVPGAIAGWFELLERWGTRQLRRAGRDRDPLRPRRLRGHADGRGGRVAALPRLLPRTSTPGSRSTATSRPATCSASPRWRGTIELLAADGPDAYYRGPVADAIAAARAARPAASWTPPTSPRTRGSGRAPLRARLPRRSRSPSSRRRPRASPCSRSLRILDGFDLAALEPADARAPDDRGGEARAARTATTTSPIPTHMPVAGRRAARPTTGSTPAAARSIPARAERPGARAPATRRHRVPLRGRRRRAARQPDPVELPRLRLRRARARVGDQPQQPGLVVLARRRRGQRARARRSARCTRSIPAMVLRDGAPCARVRIDGRRRAGPGARRSCSPRSSTTAPTPGARSTRPAGGSSPAPGGCASSARFDRCDRRRARARCGHEIRRDAARATRAWATRTRSSVGRTAATRSPPIPGPRAPRSGLRLHRAGRATEAPSTIDAMVDREIRRRRARRARASTTTSPTRASRPSIFLALTPAAAAAARGRGRRRQDRGRQGARPLDRRRARPAPVLRGHRRGPGRLRVGLLPPAAAPARGRGRAAAPVDEDELYSERFLVRRPLLRALDARRRGRRRCC